MPLTDVTPTNYQFFLAKITLNPMFFEQFLKLSGLSNSPLRAAKNSKGYAQDSELTFSPTRNIKKYELFLEGLCRC